MEALSRNTRQTGNAAKNRIDVANNGKAINAPSSAQRRAALESQGAYSARLGPLQWRGYPAGRFAANHTIHRAAI